MNYLEEDIKTIINCKKISKQFDYFFALRNLTFKIKESTIFGIAGANGAGKTTLIKILSGLTKPSGGNFSIKGLNYGEHSNKLKSNIGITIDKSFLFEELSLYENLKFYDKMHFNFNKKAIKSKIDKFTTLFNLRDWIQEPIRNLSHGMKQKVDIIRAIIHEPSILFLDEPFSGLDFKSIKILVNLLIELNKKELTTIILTTHKIEILKEICDEMIILKKGKINKSLKNTEFNEIDIKSFF